MFWSAVIGVVCGALNTYFATSLDARLGWLSSSLFSFAIAVGHA